MDDPLRLIADGLSLAAMAIMTSVSYTAAKQVAADARVPLTFDRKGEPTRRVSKGVGLWAMPVVAILVLFGLIFVCKVRPVADTQEAVMNFLVRTMIAGLFTAWHMMNINRSMKLLDREGQLRS